MFDLFSSGITIRVKKQEKVNTRVGTVLTIILILLVFIYAIYALVIMTQRTIVFTTYTTQFAYDASDPELGTLSPFSVPLESAFITTGLGWMDGGGNVVETKTVAEMDFSLTSFTRADIQCTDKMISLLAKNGFDTDNVLCKTLESFSGSNLEYTIDVMTRADGKKYKFMVTKVCRMTPKIDSKNYENPIDWGLTCTEVNLELKDPNTACIFSNYKISQIVLDTDDNYFGSSNKREYVSYIELTKEYSTFFSTDTFSFKLTFNPKFDLISRRFQKITDVLAAINGIYGLVLLVLLILGKKCVDLEQKSRLYEYLTTKRRLEIKGGTITTWDIFKAKLFYMKSARQKVDHMDKFYQEHIEDKLELSNIANFENEDFQLMSPKANDLEGAK